MEFGSIQIAVSVVLILGAAGVALLCDFLKRKNDQLREEMAELQIRRREETQASAPPTRTVSRTTVRPAMPAPAPVAMVAAAEEIPVPEAVPVAVPAAIAVEYPVERAAQHPVAAAIAR